MAVFNNLLFDVTSQSPQVDIYTTIASNGSVVYDATVATGTAAGKAVVGVLYNQIEAAGAATVALSTAGGVQLSAAPAYHGSQMALYLADRSSALFTVNTGVLVQTIATESTTNIGPNERRLRALEVI